MAPAPLWLSVDDHAFASGPVFRRPGGWLDAIRRTRSLSGARRLRAVWHRFDTAAVVADTAHLAVSARVVNRRERSSITIGGDTVIRATLRVEAKGQLAIGHSVYMGDGCVVSVMDAVSIGDGTLLAHGVQVFDNDSHPIDAADRMADFRKKLGHKLARPISIARAPVHVGRRCWLGMNTIVTKGVTIGDDTIVAAGSVVTKDLPAGVLAGGNPARVIRTLEPAKPPHG